MVQWARLLETSSDVDLEILNCADVKAGKLAGKDMLMMPGDKPFKTKEISSQINTARLSFASAEEMEEFLDITPGSVSIMGLMNDKNNRVRLLVDKDVLEGEYLGCHPCINTSSLKLRTADVFGPLLKAMRHDMTVVTLIGE